MGEAAILLYWAAVLVSWPFTARSAWRNRPLQHRTDDRERVTAILIGMLLSVFWPISGPAWFMAGPVSKALRWWMP